MSLYPNATPRELLGLLKTTVLMKAHALGAVFKNLSKKVLFTADELRRHQAVTVDDESKAAARLFNSLKLRGTILSWSNNQRFNRSYLDEALAGLVWSKTPIFSLAFELHPNANGRGYTHVPMAFSAYGGFNRRREGGQRKWDVVFENAELEADALSGAVGEIEVVITNNSKKKSWAGTLAFEQALVDLIGRKKGGGARYKHILLFTSEEELVKIAEKRGFERMTYAYAEDGTSSQSLPADSISEKIAMVYKNEVHTSVAAGNALLQKLTLGADLKKLQKTCTPAKSRVAWRRCA